MSDLTENELRAVAYYSIGVSSEGGDVAYQLSYAGKTIQEKDGSAKLEPYQGSNSGYSIGTLQTDFGSHKNDATALVENFNQWAKAKQPGWALTPEQQTQFSFDLGRDGNHIRDPNFDSDKASYGSKKAIPSSLMPPSGPDIDQTFKSHLKEFLATDAGKSFIHQRDVAQANELVTHISPTLINADFYKKESPEDQAKIFAAIAKTYNQSNVFGDRLLNDIENKKINSLADVSNEISGFIKRDAKHPEKPTYMESGRDDALSGAETFNALRNASQTNPLHEPWKAVVSNPLVNPTQLHADPKQPHLAEQYATVKGLFVEPAQGRAFVKALEQGGSHNYGDPAKSNSRGFYAECKDFVQWDRDGHGRAFVGGQWSEVSRSELALAHNQDGTLDVNISRDGQTHSLLHVTHPSSHHHSPPSAHHAQETSTLHQGMHGEQVKKLQTQLWELGYLDNTVPPDGNYGPATTKAVQSFQHDHHLPEVGRAGPATEKAIQADLQPLTQHPKPAPTATSPAPATPGPDDPRHASNADHALYSKLQQRIPDASENRLLQFTAACHMNNIKADNLGQIYFDRQDGRMMFMASWPPQPSVVVDLKIPSPEPQQSIQQIQQYDQQQAQILNQSQAQQVSQQGPTPGGHSY